MAGKLESKLQNKGVRLMILLLVSGLGLFLRWRGIWVESGDFKSCLSIWMSALENGGGLKALSRYNGDYNMPYVTVLLLLTYLPVEPIVGIKGFSILFDFVCAGAGGMLAAVCGKKYVCLKFTLAYSLIFLSPVAIINSGYWGQCDSVYAGFVLLALLAMLKEKYPLSMIFWGCAFAFKLQAIFAFPILLLYYWKNKKFSFLQFLLIPAVMEFLCLPAIIGGCSPYVTFSVYFAQMQTYPDMYYFYPNFWTFFQDTPYYVFGRMAIAGTFVLLMLESVLILGKEKTLDRENFLPSFCLIVMTILCFLPCMHERYGYILEMASIIWAVVDKKKWWFAASTQMVSVIVYMPAIVGRYLMDARIPAALYLVTFGTLVFCQVKRLCLQGEATACKFVTKAVPGAAAGALAPCAHQNTDAERSDGEREGGPGHV